ncbi:Scramblase-domain-containing protein [Phlyctochytrium arcticum]|nr:Scramblase-domain-containing protein [Phlyctochytrium arcticum]
MQLLARSIYAVPLRTSIPLLSSRICSAQFILRQPFTSSTLALYSARLGPDRLSRRAVPRPIKRAPNHPPPLDASSSNPFPVNTTETAVQPTIEDTVAVNLPDRDAPDAVLSKASGAYSVLAHPALVVTRQMEMMNVLLGYEQANKYAIKTSSGQDVGFIAEEETSFSGVISRQLLRTRRPFKAVVLDQNGGIVLKIERPLKWFLNSTITVRDENDNLIGEVKQVWHIWRRKYDLFLKQRQSAVIDSGFWAWDFPMRDANNYQIGEVNRNFVGFAREIFTDTGAYAIHMDDAERVSRPLSLDERALILTCAINIDIDYFSRHSGHHGGFMPIPFFGGGAGAAEAGAGAEVATTAAGGAVGGAVGGVAAGSVGGDMAAGAAGAAIGHGIFGGSGHGAPSAGGGGVPGDIPPPPPPPAGEPSAWGDAPFLSDDEAGVSSDSESGLGGFIRDWFDSE